MKSLRGGTHPATIDPRFWQEVLDRNSDPRPQFQTVWQRIQALSPNALRRIEERLEATLREMGVSFDVNHDKTWQTQPWICDVLPHIFAVEEWEHITRGYQQRLKAFELFLRDIYGKKEILHERVVPHTAVLGSSHYQPAAGGIEPAKGHFLHLCGLCLSRDPAGQLLVKHHYFSHASGMSYMLQNRRALARVNSTLFEDVPLQMVNSVPLEILEQLRKLGTGLSGDPFVVLLTSGTTSAVYSEHTLLARRMGIPLVEAGDLLVLNDHVFLKTVGGLEKVDVIYSRLADHWLDSMALGSVPGQGIPGLVHCIRKGSVAVINSIGSQVADDRSLLAYSNQIIGYYLNEVPILPTLRTCWLGDFDACENIFEDPNGWIVRPVYGEKLPSPLPLAALSEDQLDAVRREVFLNPTRYVAQSTEESAEAICFENGKRVKRAQDHIVFALRTGSDFRIFPGALTRTAPAHSRQTASELGGGSKDTWVLSEKPALHTLPPHRLELPPPIRRVTSRVAEEFYWLGRYLERAQNLCYMIGVIETLETEELNSAERRLYRPIWNKLLPPLERTGSRSRMSIANWLDRYRLLFAPKETGAAAAMLGKAFHNASSLQDSLSPEAWSVLFTLKTKFQRVRFSPTIDEAPAQRDTRRISEMVTNLIPQFFATARDSMLADDGWRFCEIGQMLERAVVTANAVVSMTASLASQSHEEAEFTTSEEIELSAFLRLLGSRDAYRRVYQMRAAPAEVLEILWQNPQSPRSVFRCLRRCTALIRESLGPLSSADSAALRALQELLARIDHIDWHFFFRPDPTPEQAGEARNWLTGLDDTEASRSERLAALLEHLLNEVLGLHHVLSDGFLSHQEKILDDANGDGRLHGI